MYRKTVWLDDRADIDHEVALLRAAATNAGMAPIVAEQLESSFREILSSLVSAGRTLKAQGSQFDATRTIKGEGYVVTLKFGSGRRPGIIEWVRQRVRRY